MAVDKGLGPVKRFGVRYGRTVKFKLAQIEKKQKKNQYCPYCNRVKAKRVSLGIYECKKCGAKFTGRAYFTEKKIIRTVETLEKVETEKKEEEVEA